MFEINFIVWVLLLPMEGLADILTAFRLSSPFETCLTAAVQGRISSVPVEIETALLANVDFTMHPLILGK